MTLAIVMHSMPSNRVNCNVKKAFAINIKIKMIILELSWRFQKALHLPYIYLCLASRYLSNCLLVNDRKGKRNVKGQTRARIISVIDSFEMSICAYFSGQILCLIFCDVWRHLTLLTIFIRFFLFCFENSFSVFFSCENKTLIIREKCESF